MISLATVELDINDKCRVKFVKIKDSSNKKCVYVGYSTMERDEEPTPEQINKARWRANWIFGKGQHIFFKNLKAIKRRKEQNEKTINMF